MQKEASGASKENEKRKDGSKLGSDDEISFTPSNSDFNQMVEKEEKYSSSVCRVHPPIKRCRKSNLPPKEEIVIDERTQERLLESIKSTSESSPSPFSSSESNQDHHAVISALTNISKHLETNNDIGEDMLGRPSTPQRNQAFIRGHYQ